MKTQKLYDEQELLRRLKSGDHTAFEKVFHLYKNQVANNALRLLRSADLAQELVQELFVKLWDQRSKIDVELPLGAYLYRISGNLAKDYFRRAAREMKRDGYLSYISPGAYEPVEKTLFNKETRIALEKALQKLPQQQKQVFTLCKIEEKSYQEVAEMLNISVGTVNNHLTRANSALRNLLKIAEISAPVLIVMLH
jgi:RNA polymerase sigma-70 factor (family 1)